MPFDPIAEGLWKRKHRKVEDFAVTMNGVRPRTAVVTLKADGQVFDFELAEDQMDGLRTVFWQVLQISEAEADRLLKG